MAEIPNVLFSSENRFEVGMFMLSWEAREPTLPVKIVQGEGMWHCVPDRGDIE